MANDYTLGRGELHFSRFVTGTTPGDYRYLGNSPEFNLSIETEDLDHFSSDFGIREKDASIVLEVNRSGSMILDSIDVENLALFFFGDISTETIVAAAGTTESILALEQGRSYNIGYTPATPVGAIGIDPVTFDVQPAGGGTAFVVDTDYTVDADDGYITIVEGGGIANGTGIDITYDLLGSTRERVISGNTAVEGALRYKANNPAGTNKNVFMPYVKVTPNGDIAFKGDEWQQIPLNLEILKVNEATSAIYVDGVPTYA